MESHNKSSKVKRFAPMLSGKAPDELSEISYPVLASPKIDGIRCLIIDGVAVSRSLKPIPNLHVQRLLGGRQELNGLDGELMLNGGVDFNETQSAIMSHDGEPDFVYHVFDTLRGGSVDMIEMKQIDGAPFSQRLQWVTDLAQRCPDYIKRVPHQMLYCEEELLAQHSLWLSDGYEGSMVRDPEGPYKFGRSTTKQGWLLKVKPFDDAEATVIGFEEQMHNTNAKEKDNLGNAKRSHAKAGMVPKGTLGRLTCMTDDGHEFGIGTGLTDAQKQEIWDNRDTYLGLKVKFKHQRPAKGATEGAPRLPVFLGFRHEDDISK